MPRHNPRHTDHIEAMKKKEAIWSETKSGMLSVTLIIIQIINYYPAFTKSQAIIWNIGGKICSKTCIGHRTKDNPKVKGYSSQNKKQKLPTVSLSIPPMDFPWAMTLQGTYDERYPENADQNKLFLICGSFPVHHDE